jgi:NDP-sugar pyrophosphorylase family protein
MKINYRVGILGAGLGSRLRSEAGTKPLASLGEGETLLGLLLDRFLRAGASEIRCALRDELLTEKLRATLPRPAGVDYLFKDTDSSLHTLAELIRSWPARSPTLFSMADTVMLPADFERFLAFCRSLPPGENAVLVTTFIDDEKPLYVRADGQGNAVSFGSEPTPLVTSGMYFLQPEAMEIALELVNSGTHKMRNFLSELAARGAPIKTFVVGKTIDVDHPSDLAKAAAFLRGD